MGYEQYLLGCRPEEQLPDGRASADTPDDAHKASCTGSALLASEVQVARPVQGGNDRQLLVHRFDTGVPGVLGFDDFPMADLVDPPLTVIRQDIEAIGQRMVSLLWGRLDGETSTPQHVVLPVDLVQRSSGEIPGP